MIQKYLKSFLVIMLSFLLLIFLTTVFHHFNFLNSTVAGYIKMIIPIVSMLLGGWFIGRHSKENGWLEGLKIGLIFLVFLFLLSYLGFQEGMHLKTWLYDGILLISSILGSMIGINHKKTT